MTGCKKFQEAVTRILKLEKEKQLGELQDFCEKGEKQCKRILKAQTFRNEHFPQETKGTELSNYALQPLICEYNNEIQEKAIDKIKEVIEEGGQATTRKVKQIIEKIKIEKENKENPLPQKKKYKVIYVDPPWQYNDKRSTHPRISGGAESHYNTMSLERIKALSINELASENCILFLWVTFPNLKEGLEVIESWGFKYKTLGFSWIKLNKNGKPFFGIGHYTKSNCEVCLIGVKGSPVIISDKVSSVILSQREKHSKKPSVARQRIEELCGEVSRVELFAREKIKGWDSWGDEV